MWLELEMPSAAYVESGWWRWGKESVMQRTLGQARVLGLPFERSGDPVCDFKQGDNFSKLCFLMISWWGIVRPKG